MSGRLHVLLLGAILVVALVLATLGSTRPAQAAEHTSSDAAIAAVNAIKAWPVRIKVVDAANQPLVDATITLQAGTPLQAQSDDYGVVVFAAVPAGTHKVTYQSGDTVYTQTITVNPSYSVVDDKPIVREQTYTVRFGFTQPNYWWLPWAVLAGGLAVIFVVSRLIHAATHRPHMAHGTEADD